MPREIVQSGSIRYTIATDDARAEGERFSALATVRAIDELTGEPVRGEIDIESDLRHGVKRIGDGGIAGIVGIPRRAFPGLATTSYIARITVSATDFVTAIVPLTLAPQAGPPAFPQTYSPPAIVDVALHRRPTVIAGRVMQLSGTTIAPAPGASVSITGIWRTAPPPTLSPPADAPNLVSIQPALQASRNAATTTMTPQPLTPIAGDDKTLVQSVQPGSTSLRVSNRLNLVAGDVVVIDPQDPFRSELLVISNVSGEFTPDQPGTIALAAPTALAHRAGAIVQRTLPGAASPAIAIAQDAIPGDSTIFLANLAGMGAPQSARISSGAADDEFHVAMTYTAIAGPDGYYALPPISRVAQVEIVASMGGLSNKIEMQPSYSLPENRLDLLIE